MAPSWWSIIIWRKSLSKSLPVAAFSLAMSALGCMPGMLGIPLGIIPPPGMLGIPLGILLIWWPLGIAVGSPQTASYLFIVAISAV
jgi:hypothetical protein